MEERSTQRAEMRGMDSVGIFEGDMSENPVVVGYCDDQRTILVEELHSDGTFHFFKHRLPSELEGTIEEAVVRWARTKGVACTTAADVKLLVHEEKAPGRVEAPRSSQQRGRTHDQDVKAGNARSTTAPGSTAPGRVEPPSPSQQGGPTHDQDVKAGNARSTTAPGSTDFEVKIRNTTMDENYEWGPLYDDDTSRFETAVTRDAEICLYDEIYDFLEAERRNAKVFRVRMRCAEGDPVTSLDKSNERVRNFAQRTRSCYMLVDIVDQILLVATRKPAHRKDVIGLRKTKLP